MNQYIEICYKPDFSSDPNYWDFWFYLNSKYHREKAPSDLDSNGYWTWDVHDKSQKRGYNFDWKKE